MKRVFVNTALIDASQTGAIHVVLGASQKHGGAEVEIDILGFNNGIVEARLVGGAEVMVGYRRVNRGQSWGNMILKVFVTIQTQGTGNTQFILDYFRGGLGVSTILIDGNGIVGVAVDGAFRVYAIVAIVTADLQINKRNHIAEVVHAFEVGKT